MLGNSTTQIDNHLHRIGNNIYSINRTGESSARRTMGWNAVAAYLSHTMQAIAFAPRILLRRPMHSRRRTKAICPAGINIL